MNNGALQIKSSILTLVFLFTFGCISSNALALQISGVGFDENYVEDGFNMSLQGTGFKSFLFFKAFEAGFYKGESDDSDLLGDYPKRIEVEYFINIPGAKLNDFTIEVIKNNVSKFELDSLHNEIKQMGKYFVDLKPGDRFSLTYIPYIGTKFSHNGQLVGIIKGIRFARALFSVWIGKKPFDNHLKEEVLGLNRGV